MFSLVDLLHFSKEQKASDVFLQSGKPPAVKVCGKVSLLDQSALTHDVATKSVYQLLNSIQSKAFESAPEDNVELVFGIEHDNLGRFRLSVFKNIDGITAVIRLLYPPKSLDDLGLDSVLGKFVDQSGLLLITGNQGSGKSMTVSAILETINTHFQKYILTIENPVEIKHFNGTSVISQREEPLLHSSRLEALKLARFGAADVLYIDQLPDYRVMRHALEFAEAGALVIAPFFTRDPIATITTFIQSFPPSEQPLVNNLLMRNLLGVFSQNLHFRNGYPEIGFSLFEMTDQNRTLWKEGHFEDFELIQKYGIR